MRGPSTSIGSSDPRRSNATHQEGTNVDRAHVRCSFRPVSRIHAALSIPIDHWNFQPSHPTSRFDRLFAHAFLALVNRSYSINQSVHSDTYSTVNIYTSNMFFFFLLSTKFPDHKWFPTINDFFFYIYKIQFLFKELITIVRSIQHMDCGNDCQMNIHQEFLWWIRNRGTERKGEKRISRRYTLSAGWSARDWRAEGIFRARTPLVKRGDDTRYALLRARSVTQPARNAILLHIRCAAAATAVALSNDLFRHEKGATFLEDTLAV